MMVWRLMLLGFALALAACGGGNNSGPSVHCFSEDSAHKLTLPSASQGPVRVTCPNDALNN